MSVLAEKRKQQIGDDRADVKADRPYKRKLSVDDPRVVLGHHYGTSMEIAMDQGFGRAEKFHLQA